MAASFTDADLAELTERLRAATEGDGAVPIALLREGVAATKPKRARKPPKAPADPHVTTIKRLSTNVLKLATKIRNARQHIEDVNAKGDKPRASLRDHECATLFAYLPGWQSELTYRAEQLARCVREYFGCTDPKEKPQ